MITFKQFLLQESTDLPYVYHVTNKKNLNSIKKHGIMPKTPEDMGGEQEAVYLFTSIESRDNALMNWFGQRIEDLEEELGITIELVSLKISTKGLNLVDAGVGYEVSSLEIIPPQNIVWNEIEEV